jgi:hypothetical protein
MPVGLSPAASPTIESELLYISANCAVLSTLTFPAKADPRGGLSPYRTAAYFGQAIANFSQD